MQTAYGLCDWWMEPSWLYGTMTLSLYAHRTKNDLDNSTFKATVDPATINTKSSGRDKHLQKDDFFGTNSFPLIHMSSKKIIKTEKGFMAIAELQIRDFKTEVKLPFKLSFNADNQQVLQGEFTLNRLDYNLGEQIGEQSIGFEVDIAIYCVVTI